MENIKYSLYENGILIHQEDNRLVSICAERKRAEIRYKATELIISTGIDWMAAREISGGKPIPQDVKDQCAAYRAKSNDLEAQVAGIVASAMSNDDKEVCDAIEDIVWR
jgi:hypothetical protein